METKEAILAFSQSEKAKAGLLMAAQLLEIYNGLPDHEKHTAERFLRPLVGMISNEIYLSKTNDLDRTVVQRRKKPQHGAGDDELGRAVRGHLPYRPGHQRRHHDRPAFNGISHPRKAAVKIKPCRRMPARFYLP